MKFGINILFYIVISILFFSCNRDHLDVDVSDIQVDSKAKRFEQDLFKSFKPGMKSLSTLRHDYGGFVDVFIHRILMIPEGSDSIVSAQLALFVADSEINDVFQLTDSAYKNIDDVNAGMEVFLKNLHYYFP